ncbi:MAG: F0F1 ATP synthase subunit A [Candidatus Curtissbacteria bacterium]|nr:F0F1 ATP synthase subunit A [Candidatus Curtissbacteria bacterium]
MAEAHFSLAAEELFKIGPLPITNTILTTWIVTIILITFAYLATRKISPIPHGIQNVAEFAVESLSNLVESVAGDKTKVFLPIIASFFFFILVGNYMGLLPGFGTIGFYENIHGEKTFVPYLRSINSDLNTTLGLALISVGFTHYYAVKYLGISDYLKKWFSLNPIFLFVGIMELVGEFTKIISLSFRLFGNVFAGEVVLATASTKLFAFIIPVPFYFLELLVGFVQALIFAILTLAFMVILTNKEGH